MTDSLYKMEPDTDILFVLDPGHGKTTPGKRSPKWPDGTQLFEYEFNRDIVRRIGNSLLNSGIYHIWTTLSNYDMPLENRVHLANRAVHTHKHVIYVSVHANAGGGTGWEVFTSKGNTDSDQYAEIFFNKMKKEFPNMTFRADYLDGDSDKEENFYVLRKTICPAVLTENFFMDTYDPDCKILLSEDGREKIAKGHINAINEIYKQLKT